MSQGLQDGIGFFIACLGVCTAAFSLILLIVLIMGALSYLREWRAKDRQEERLKAFK